MTIIVTGAAGFIGSNIVKVTIEGKPCEGGFLIVL